MPSCSKGSGNRAHLAPFLPSWRRIPARLVSTQLLCTTLTSLGPRSDPDKQVSSPPTTQKASHVGVHVCAVWPLAACRTEAAQVAYSTTPAPHSRWSVLQLCLPCSSTSPPQPLLNERQKIQGPGRSLCASILPPLPFSFLSLPFLPRCWFISTFISFLRVLPVFRLKLQLDTPPALTTIFLLELRLYQLDPSIHRPCPSRQLYLSRDTCSLQQPGLSSAPLLSSPEACMSRL